MKGRGQNQPHQTAREKGETGKVPRVSLDYMFMSQEDERASRNPIIIIKNEGTGELYARAVGQKGLGEDGIMDWLVKDISKELNSWSHYGGQCLSV